MPPARLQLAAVLALTFAVTAPALGNGFAYDGALVAQVEGHASGAHPYVRELHWPWTYWLTEFKAGVADTNTLHRPTTVWTLALVQAFGAPLLGEAFAQHLVNLLLHLACVALTWVLVRRLMPQAPPRARDVASALAALTFGLHAVHAEIVAGVIGRAELLGVALGLGGCLLALGPDGRLAAGARRRALAVAALLFAFGSKESMASFLPFVAVVGTALGVAHGRRVLGSVRDALVPTVLLALPPFLVWFAARAVTLAPLEGKMFWIMNPLLLEDTSTRLATATVAWAYGLGMMFVPWPLVCDYSAQVFVLREGFGDPVALGALLLLLALTAATLLAARSRPLWFAAGAAFLGLSFVTSNIPFALSTIFAERFYYAPSLGLALGVAAAAAGLARGTGAGTLRRAALGAWTLWIVWNAVLLVDRIPDWNDNDTLFRRDVVTQPRSARLHAMVGRLDAEAGRADEAIARFERTVELAPEYASGWNDLGGMLLYVDRLDAAEAALARVPDAAWQQDLDVPASYLNRARIARIRGRPDLAARHLGEAVRARPGFFPAWAELRDLYGEQAERLGPERARELLSGLSRYAPPQVRNSLPFPD